MTVELNIMGEGNAWNNFVLANLVDTSPTIDDVNELLVPYRARIVDHTKWAVTFDSEQDKAFFVLRWA